MLHNLKMCKTENGYHGSRYFYMYNVLQTNKQFTDKPFSGPSPWILICGRSRVVIHKVSDSLLRIAYLPPLWQRILCHHPSKQQQQQQQDKQWVLRHDPGKQQQQQQDKQRVLRHHPVKQQQQQDEQLQKKVGCRTKQKRLPYNELLVDIIGGVQCYQFIY